MTSIISEGSDISFKYESDTLSYSLDAGDTWNPCSNAVTITNNTLSQINVYFTTDITFTTDQQYFILNSNRIIVDGMDHTITLSGITNYPGLFQNGTVTTNGSQEIMIKNIIIHSESSTLENYAGWICQSYFARGSGNAEDGESYCYIENCSSNGPISDSAGGICGAYLAANNGHVIISNCSTTGLIGSDDLEYSGGIIGKYGANNSGDPNDGYTQITISNCTSTGIIGYGCGGICGGYCAYQLADSNVIVISGCSSTGLISDTNAGGICGRNCGSVNINSSSSSGNIAGYGAGGIVGGSGATASHMNILSCHSTGIISGERAGGIMGRSAGSSGGTINLTRCFSSGLISGVDSGGLIGAYMLTDSSTTANIELCYSVGDITGLRAGGLVGGAVGFSGDTIYQPVINITTCYVQGNIAEDSYGMFGLPAEGEYTAPTINVTNSYTSGTIRNVAYCVIAIFTPNITDCYFTEIWSDAEAGAIHHLTGILDNSVWVSVSPNTPYLLTTFDSDIYDLRIAESQTGNFTSESGLFENQTYRIFKTVQSDTADPSRITIDANTGVITFRNVQSYMNDVYVLASEGESRYYNYNIGILTVNVDTLLADTCFHPDTLIPTDQGLIYISDINPNIHTLNNRKINYLTQTKYSGMLIYIPKHVFSNTFPTYDLLVSLNHKIYYNGVFMEAYKIYDILKIKKRNLKKIKYDGILFNILMDKHTFINVGGLICETLDPNHYVAKLYNNQNVSHLQVKC